MCVIRTRQLSASPSFSFLILFSTEENTATMNKATRTKVYKKLCPVSPHYLSLYPVSFCRFLQCVGMFASNFIGPSIAADICTRGAALVFLCVLGMDLLANGDPLIFVCFTALHQPMKNTPKASSNYFVRLFVYAAICC